MNPSMMMIKLKEYLWEITEEMFLGPLRLRPNIYLVDLPPRETVEADEPPYDMLPSDVDERWPFIVIRYSDSEDNEEGYRTANLELVFGSEGEGPNGYMDVLHLMEHVRSYLLRETWEGWSFALTRPLNMGFYDEQAEPRWLGWMSTNWHMPSMTREVWQNGF